MGEGVDLQSGLKNDASIPIQDKLSNTEALDAKWDLQDIKSPLGNETLKAQQKIWYNELGMIIFDIVLQEIF